MNRTEARAAAMKLIYEWEMGGTGGDDTLAGILEIVPGENEYEYMAGLVQSVIADSERIDMNIQKHAVGWKLDRLMKVDLAILRIATCELMKASEPPAAIINEAIELSHIYSTDKAGIFINGVLGSMLREGIE